MEAGGRNKKVHRTAPKSENVYLKLLVKVRCCLSEGSAATQWRGADSSAPSAACGGSSRASRTGTACRQVHAPRAVQHVVTEALARGVWLVGGGRQRDSHVH